MGGGGGGGGGGGWLFTLITGGSPVRTKYPPTTIIYMPAQIKFRFDRFRDEEEEEESKRVVVVPVFQLR